MSKAELLAAVWMATHPNKDQEDETLESYIGQFDFLVKNFQSVIDNSKDN